MKYKELLFFHIIIFICFCFIVMFLHIIFFLYKQFGIIGLKEKDFKISPIFNDLCKNIHFNNLDIYKDYYSNSSIKNIFDPSITSSINDIYQKIVKERWFKMINKPLNLDNPVTFNEKIQWLKLYNSIPIKTRLADKYLVREYVKNKIGKEYLIPLLGVYDKFEEINFGMLPDKFVIKCNHGSGYNIIVKDKSKLNLKDIQTTINNWMNINYPFVYGMELHYRDIEPKIIIEEFMDDGTGDLKDYKITCFNGKPELIWVDSDRFTNHKRNLYDLNWKQLPYKINSHYETFPSPEKPKNLKKLLKFASILSNNFIYVRVDFYIINQKIFFSEMTFASESGYGNIEPHNFDLYLGSLIKLPKLAYNIDIGEYYFLKNPFKTKLYLIYPNIMVVFSLIIWVIHYIYKKLKFSLR